MPVIEITELTYDYTQGVHAIDNIDLSLEGGRYIAVLGHNGSGKSTLAKLLLGLLEPQTGSIKLFGELLSEASVMSLRQKVGIVFQNPDNQFIGSTVRDDLAFGLENRCIPQKEMDALIDQFAAKVGMSDYLDKEPTHLSGGQKQRVAIAGVLAMQPKIIIFDEATVMLDPKGRNEIRQLIQTMRDADPELTILSITHDVEEALLADEVVVMNQGKIAVQGTPEQVFADMDALRSIDLRAPFVIELKEALAKLHIQVPPTFDLTEMVVSVCRSNSKR